MDRIFVKDLSLDWTEALIEETVQKAYHHSERWSNNKETVGFPIKIFTEEVNQQYWS